MVGSLDIMHDGGNAGLLIFHVGIVIQGFVAYLFDLLIFILCSLQLLFKGINLTLQLTELGHQICIIAEVTELGGYIVLFRFQNGYLTFEVIDNLLLVSKLFIQFSNRIIVIRETGFHRKALTGFTQGFALIAVFLPRCASFTKFLAIGTMNGIDDR